MELMTFELTQKPLVGFCCQIISVKEENRHLLPLGMTIDGDGILSWLKSRILPSKRANSDRILFVFGLANNNIPGIIQLCKGLSLNDTSGTDFLNTFYRQDQIPIDRIELHNFLQQIALSYFAYNPANNMIL